MVAANVMAQRGKNRESTDAGRKHEGRGRYRKLGPSLDSREQNASFSGHFEIEYEGFHLPQPNADRGIENIARMTRH